jgi:hypothetical protein
MWLHPKTMSQDMEAQARRRQFWLRSLLSVGIVWGLIPLITLPFITHGTNDSALDVWAAISNGVTLLPVSVLAFWHRRIACVWLTINGALVVSSISTYVLRTHSHPLASMIGAVVSAIVAISLDVMEVQRWPGALDRRPRSKVA